MRKIIAIVMTASMILLLYASSVYASDWLDEIDCQELFGVSREYINSLSNEELEKLHNVYNFTFSENNNFSLYSGGDGGITNESLTQSGVDAALRASFKGGIWVTRDDSTPLIDHGHAALVYTVADWDRSTIEHRGSGTGNGLSNIYNLDGDSYWQSRRTLKVYDVSDTDNGGTSYFNMMAAADYASFNLLDLEYALLALKTAPSVNCATLVYKAYKYGYGDESPIILGSASSPTVIPKDLVEDPKCRLKYSFQWPGAHTWDLTE